MDVDSLYFRKTHEWLSVDGDQATIGITAFAIEQLTDLVFIELPEVGRELKAGETFGEVESVKAVSDLYAPVSGKVVAVNDALPDDPGILSDDPYEQGWMIRITLSQPDEIQELLDHGRYQQHCASESH